LDRQVISTIWWSILIRLITCPTLSIVYLLIQQWWHKLLARGLMSLQGQLSRVTGLPPLTVY
jgi:hypothetical protein